VKETKINQNTKLLKDLELGITKSLDLVRALEKTNEFVNYWLCCYDSERFEAVDLFHAVVFDESLNFEPSELYHNTWARSTNGTGNDYCYEWSSSKSHSRKGINSKKINVPSKFNAGPIHLSLGHHETDSKDVLFIPTECLMAGRNRELYPTLKRLTPRGSFPSEFYSESISGAYNRMRSEISHAVVVYRVDQNGDQDVSVRWHSSHASRYSDFFPLDAVFDHLWEGISVYPFSY
tara:strand:- start:2346 stop:3050 length:705 start_codon:yes stop_codon:yes gene_type:complete